MTNKPANLLGNYALDQQLVDYARLVVSNPDIAKYRARLDELLLEAADRNSEVK